MTFDPRSLKPHQFVNQFPYENMITCKDLLVLVAKRASNSGATLPSWLPLTFNLLYELPRLVRCYKEREERLGRLKSHDSHVILCCVLCRGLANVWIVKPWNLGRGLGIAVTDNLAEIIRLAQVGPKVTHTHLYMHT